MKHKIDHFSWVLGTAVLISRVVMHASVYFADGPAEVASIHDHTYLIQPPGYWLQHRIASLFPNGEFGLLFLNWVFSTLGVVVFYWTAKKLVALPLARWGAVAYATVFYIWFSGCVHSTYASQLLFPVLCFYLLLLYRDTQHLRYLLGAAASFAIGAGMRPSDGVFLAPVVVVCAFYFGPWKKAMLALGFSALLALIWVIPTCKGYFADNADRHGLRAVTYTQTVLSEVSVLHVGITRESIATVLRYFVPMVVAFWSLMGGIWLACRRWKNEMPWLLLLWIVPGSLFFVFSYMSYAPYLDFLTAAVILLALIGLENRRLAVPALLTCILFNSALFLLARPIHSRSLAVEIYDAYCVKCTRWAIHHQWWPNLGEIIANGIDRPGKGRPAQTWSQSMEAQ